MYPNIWLAIHLALSTLKTTNIYYEVRKHLK